MSIKKKILLALGAAVLTATLTASVVTATATTDSTGLNLEIAGSTTLGPVIAVAAPLFNAQSSTVQVNVADIAQVSSGVGIGDLNATPQTADIAMSSRPLKTSAPETNDTATQACIDAVILMVNSAHTPSDITQLTKQQIRGIYEDVYALSSNSGDPSSGAGSTNEYWDAAAVTISSTGIIGDDGLAYDVNEYFPALPGYGNSADHVQIAVLARNLDSGTRGFLGDTIAHGGCAFATGASSTDPVYSTNPNASLYPLEEKFLGTTDTNRVGDATTMSNDINNATNAALGYAGVGYDTGANIRDLKVEDDLNLTSGSWSTAPYNPVPVDPNYYPPTNINIYSYHYHLTRYLYLVTLNGDPNHSNDMAFINWFTPEDSVGQDTAVVKHELRLIPDQDINNLGIVSSGDLTQLGEDYGRTDVDGSGHPLMGTAHLRSDIDRVGIVSSQDLTDLGNWYGVVIVHPPA